jgi:hypothetical protein
VPGRLGHDIEDLADEVGRHLSVEEVAHAVDEDDPRLAPAAWHVERLRVDRDAEAGPGGARVAITLVLGVAIALSRLARVSA